jgi:hypothetical protein
VSDEPGGSGDEHLHGFHLPQGVGALTDAGFLPKAATKVSMLLERNKTVPWCRSSLAAGDHPAPFRSGYNCTSNGPNASVPRPIPLRFPPGRMYMLCCVNVCKGRVAAY